MMLKEHSKQVILRVSLQPAQQNTHRPNIVTTHQGSVLLKERSGC
jgi:hypothetical protein